MLSVMLVLACQCSWLISASITVSEQGEGFPLVADGRAATVVVSPDEPLVVQKAAALFAEDVYRVTGVMPQVAAKGRRGAVVIATIGCNKAVDKLIANGRLDVSAIRGGWEQFVLRMLDGQLYVVGSDRRGTAYGIFALSEAIGVSPWYWWADVPVAKHTSLYVTTDYAYARPSIKYRGIFINDEDWGLKPWAAKNYETELGDIGPRTYARVCELLLRLKANMLAPAMHSCTGAFYSHPESKVVCDSFGIIVTTSHCEPLLLNNAAISEWDQQRDGDWNYKTNRQTIQQKWDNRLGEAAQYENIYTVAMRGLHDAGLRGNLPMEERVPLIDTVISDQRQLLERHIGRMAKEIPQIFVPYKETMDIYENGLHVPDDITLVWVDDNYGYLKRVSSPEEQQRAGHAGVYYHLSYLGAPHDYLWLNTTPPVLMYEELKKAYDTGADRYWLLNVGDIKPMELGIQTFMDMEWNMDSFSFENAYAHQAKLLAGLFGKSEAELTNLLDDYYRLAWSRKPEFMGWEYEWDDKEHTGLKATEFSFQNYGEAQKRLEDYQQLSDQVERMSDGSAAYYEMLQFPVQAAYQMNRKFLMAQLNQELAAKGRFAEANWAAKQMEQAFDSIDALNKRYNELLGGKWRHMMTLPTGWCALYHQKPEVIVTDGVGEEAVNLRQLVVHQHATDCTSLELSAYCTKAGDVSLIKGLGYDGQVLQLGLPLSNNQATVSYQLPAILADSIEVTIYSVPFWPLYAGKSNAVSISVDNGQPQVFENRFKEYDRTWKDQVMRNGAIGRLRFALDPKRASHTISFSAIDGGQMLQRILVDWGGAQKSYLGPQPKQAIHE